MITIRKPYESLKTTRQTKTKNSEPSRTKQNLAEALNVNNIIKKYNKTGVLQKAHDFEALYGDFNSYDLREALDKITKADEIFQTVPSDIRAKFNNDSGAFIDYATNPQNLNALVDMGLAKKPPHIATEETSVPPTPPTPPQNQPEKETQ